MYSVYILSPKYSYFAQKTGAGQFNCIFHTIAQSIILDTRKAFKDQLFESVTLAEVVIIVYIYTY